MAVMGSGSRAPAMPQPAAHTVLPCGQGTERQNPPWVWQWQRSEMPPMGKSQEIQPLVPV